jgi:chromosomal replication initiation ATPase DnaA
MVCAAAMHVSKWGHLYNPLFNSWWVGLGKTHLMHGGNRLMADKACPKFSTSTVEQFVV